MKGFGEAATAHAVVTEFLGEDHTLINADPGSKERPQLTEFFDMQGGDVYKQHEFTFKGSAARTLRKALKQAAERGETYQDAAAAHLLAQRNPVASTEPPQNEILTLHQPVGKDSKRSEDIRSHAA